MSAKTILNGPLNVISRMAKDFEKLDEGEIEIAGKRAPRAVFQQARKDVRPPYSENL